MSCKVCKKSNRYDEYLGNNRYRTVIKCVKCQSPLCHNHIAYIVRRCEGLSYVTYFWCDACNNSAQLDKKAQDFKSTEISLLILAFFTVIFLIILLT